MRKFKRWTIFELFFVFLLQKCADSSPITNTSSIMTSKPSEFSDQMKMLNAAPELLKGTVPPHCSRAIVMPSQSSTLTKREVRDTLAFADTTPSSNQLTINIGVAQTVCFRLVNQSTRSELEESKNSSEEKTGIKPNEGRRTEALPNHLHTLTLADLEQYYPITERYRFAVPELQTKCICECESSTANCLADDYKYGKCPEEFLQGNLRQKSPSSFSSACYRTFFANQPIGEGCRNRTSTPPRLCCDLRFDPYQGRSFTAVRLELPTTSAMLHYTVFTWNAMQQSQSSNASNTRGWWKEVESRKIRVQLDGSTHNVILNGYLGLKLSVLGMGGSKDGGNQLEPGMYFVENTKNGGYSEIIGQIPVNRIAEHDFHKLGWFRLRENGAAFVQTGDILLDKIHHARAEHCAAQKYRSVLDASYYINGDKNSATRFKIPEPLRESRKWIRSANIFDSQERLAIVQVTEGTTLEATVAAAPSHTGPTFEIRQNSSPLISFVHNSSTLADFDALIVVDSLSNSLLNLTLYNATGIINGYIRRLEDKTGNEIDTFSVHIPSKLASNQRSNTRSNIMDDTTNSMGYTTASNIVRRIKPYPIHSVHIVCLRPDDADVQREICRPVQSIHYQLELNTVTNEWNEATADCPECNQITVDGFMRFLNPANWTKGITSLSEALMLVSDIFAYLFAFLIFYVIATRVFFPLIGCFCISPTRIWKKSG